MIQSAVDLLLGQAEGDSGLIIYVFMCYPTPVPIPVHWPVVDLFFFFFLFFSFIVFIFFIIFSPFILVQFHFSPVNIQSALLSFEQSHSPRPVFNFPQTFLTYPVPTALLRYHLK